MSGKLHLLLQLENIDTLHMEIKNRLSASSAGAAGLGWKQTQRGERESGAALIHTHQRVGESREREKEREHT